ncbi:TadE/TadG family type IV pilus assembly protein [Microvirga makkahensis]|uniref:Putative Flp pilus-assembly TadG-like N-terminal domain-containing protein n=1 Tax=Microvirga makkahensis TaxID=1128670 RepID=A0A7X3SN06_9HYPH|nr:pilus assembly protein TadG-related protein [Microvirga makkahensis]MXQ10683.1 hypothetical protein [Microvirga makkahensis]
MRAHLSRSQYRAEAFRAKLSTFRTDDGGAIAVVAAIVFPVLIGAMGLGAEAGYWYLAQRKLQHAADVSAHAAAIRKRAGDDQSGIAAAALHVAQASGFSSEAGTIQVSTPPTSHAYSGDRSSIEVVLTQVQPLLFSSLFLSDPVNIHARAVAKLDMVSQACILALSPSAPGAVTVAGSTVVTLNGCDVASNSNASDSLKMQGGGHLTTDCISTVGGAVTTSDLTLQTCDAVREQAPVTMDPYADVSEPAISGTCYKPDSYSTGSALLTPTYQSHPSGLPTLRFCAGLKVTGGSITFNPGLYIIEGEFAVSAGTTLVGSGVTFYMAKGASLKLNGGAQINLDAPAEGPFAGILFFGARDSTVASHQVNGASGSAFNGAIYFPGSGIEYSGRAGSTGGCTQIIGKTVTFTGNSEVQSDCQATGTRPIVTSQSVKLVE